MVVEIAVNVTHMVRTGIHVNPAIYNAIQVEMKVENTANIGYCFFTEDTEDLTHSRLLPSRCS